jgi:AcrR family transcriptional regulator
MRSLNQYHRTNTRARQDKRRSTQESLLDAAGQVFAEKGPYRATGKEICELAGANSAAVNYYFGGIEGLYAAVLAEANNRLLSLDELTQSGASGLDAQAKLGLFFELALKSLFLPKAGWALRVVGREFLSPSAAVSAWREQQTLASSAILRRIVSEIMDLPPRHSAVAWGCITVVAPLMFLVVADRPILLRAYPGLTLSVDAAPTVARQLSRHAIAGLRAAHGVVGK